MFQIGLPSLFLEVFSTCGQVKLPFIDKIVLLVSTWEQVDFMVRFGEDFSLFYNRMLLRMDEKVL